MRKQEAVSDITDTWEYKHASTDADKLALYETHTSHLRRQVAEARGNRQRRKHWERIGLGVLAILTGTSGFVLIGWAFGGPAGALTGDGLGDLGMCIMCLVWLGIHHDRDKG